VADLMAGFLLYRVFLTLAVPIGLEIVALSLALDTFPTLDQLFARGELFLLTLVLLLSSAETLWRARAALGQMVRNTAWVIHQRIFLACAIGAAIQSVLVAILWAGVIQDVVTGNDPVPSWLPTAGGITMVGLALLVSGAFAWYAAPQRPFSK
jgi:hypothetical protein